MRTPREIEEFGDRVVRAVDRIYDLPVRKQIRAAFWMLFRFPLDGGFPFFLLLMRIALYHLWWEFRYRGTGLVWRDANSRSNHTAVEFKAPDHK